MRTTGNYGQEIVSERVAAKASELSAFIDCLAHFRVSSSVCLVCSAFAKRVDFDFHLLLVVVAILPHSLRLFGGCRQQYAAFAAF